MSEPYVGEIRLIGFSFAPVGWGFCDGSLQSIAQNVVLFDLIGTTYGGDGVSTFALPNLLGRLPIHQGPGFVIGQISGSENVTLTSSQLPSHSHPAFGSGAAASLPSPTAASLPALTVSDEYVTPTAVVAMTPTSGGPGGSQPHANLMPYQCINYIISFFGVFPSQS